MHATCFEQPSVSAHKIELQLKDNLAPAQPLQGMRGRLHLENDNKSFLLQSKAPPHNDVRRRFYYREMMQSNN